MGQIERGPMLSKGLATARDQIARGEEPQGAPFYPQSDVPQPSARGALATQDTDSAGNNNVPSS